MLHRTEKTTNINVKLFVIDFVFQVLQSYLLCGTLSYKRIFHIYMISLRETTNFHDTWLFILSTNSVNDIYKYICLLGNTEDCLTGKTFILAVHVVS